MKVHKSMYFEQLLLISCNFIGICYMHLCLYCDYTCFCCTTLFIILITKSKTNLVALAQVPKFVIVSIHIYFSCMNFLQICCY